MLIHENILYIRVSILVFSQKTRFNFPAIPLLRLRSTRLLKLFISSIMRYRKPPGAPVGIAKRSEYLTLSERKGVKVGGGPFIASAPGVPGNECRGAVGVHRVTEIKT